MKFFLLFIVFLLCSFTGYFYSKKYRTRLDFFYSLISLCQKFDVEINFSRARVKNIFLSIDEKTKKKLCGLDSNYLTYLSGQKSLEREDLFSGINFLKDNEKDLIFAFFNQIGRSDVDSQSKETKNYQSRFESFYDSAQNDNKKYGALALKLGIVAGLFLIVIFV